MTVPSVAGNPPYSSGSSVAVAEPRPADTVLYPTAVSGPKSAATHALGEVLKTLIHNSHFFPTENQVDAAMNTVDKWVSTQVSGSEMGAILTGDERAAKEDVTKRTPPGGPMQMNTGPQIDYRQLAEAIIAAQNRAQAQLEGPAQ